MRSRVLFYGVLFFIITSCLHLACKEETPPQPPPPPPYVSTVQLAIEDTSVTDVWLKLRFTDTTMPRNYQLRRNGAIVLSGTLATSDTVLLDTTALPKRTYQYKAYRLNNTTLTDSSAALSVTTMDTTSHNFTWQIDTLGVGNSSVLYDVAIISDTLAYAVGELYLRNDSTGQLDPIPYNMAKWDGGRWHPMRIQFYTICGQSSRTPYPASSIFAFSATDVWVTSRGGQLARWNGTTQTATICMTDPFVINKIWGENPNSIWAVGYGGRIGHYASGTWRRVESGTSLSFYDVYGDRNERTQELEIFAVASSLQSFERKIVRLRASGIQAVPDSNLMPYGGLTSIWCKAGKIYMANGAGIFVKQNIVSPSVWKHLANVTPFATTGESGNDVNDILVTGAFGELLHFNGYSWVSFRQDLGLYNSVLGEVAIKGNLVIAVGFNGNRGLAIRGRR